MKRHFWIAYLLANIGIMIYAVHIYKAGPFNMVVVQPAVAVACIVGAFFWAPKKAPWFAFSFGLVAFVFANFLRVRSIFQNMEQLMFSLEPVEGAAPEAAGGAEGWMPLPDTPSWHDLVFALGYVAFLVGAIALVKARASGKERGGVGDAMVIAGVTGFLGWAYVMVPFATLSLPTAHRVSGALYLLCDLVIIGLISRLAVGQGARPVSYYFFMIGLIGHAATNLLVAMESAHLILGHRTPIVAAAASIALGVAVLHPSMARLTVAPLEVRPRVRGRWLVFLTAGVLIAPALVIARTMLKMQSIDGGMQMSGTWLILLGVIGGTAMVAMLILGRMSDLVRLHELASERERHLLNEVAAREARFRSVIQNASDLIVLMDEEAIVSFASPATTKLLNCEPEEVVGKAFIDFLHPDDRSLFGITQVEHQFRVELRVVSSQDTLHYLDVQVTDLRNDPAVGAIVMNARDITDRHELEIELRRQARHDALTGLANRKLLEERLEHSFQRRNAAGGVAILFIDVDDFKTINDSLGHNIGDELLIEASRRIQSCVRQSDTVARFGGDEFAVILEDITDATAAFVLAQRIHDTLSEPVELESQTLTVTGSIGVASDMSRTVSPEVLLRNADTAMYLAKHNGKGQVAAFDESLYNDAVERMELMLQGDDPDTRAS